MTSNFTTIEKLSFLFADSARYLNSLDAEKFHRSFFIPEQMSRLADQACYFIIGDKGTGKTAFATYVSNGYHQDLKGVTISVEKGDFDSFTSLSSSLAAPLSYADYIELWEALLVVASYHKLSQSFADQGLEKPSQIKVLDAAIRKLSYESKLDRFGDIFDLVVWDRAALYAHLRDIFPSRLSAEMPTQLRPYLRVIESVFSDATQEFASCQSKFAIFIDGFDTRPVATHQSPASADVAHLFSVSALVNAVWNLNTKVYAPKFANRFRIILLVRPDILERVNIQNTSLIIKDSSILLNWYARNNAYRGADLFRLADNMLRQQQQEPDQFKEGECWDHYFPEGIRLVGDRERDPFVAMAYNSFYRPRDVITFLSTFRDAMVREGVGQGTQFLISMINAPSVRKPYSEYLLGEVKDSTLFYYDLREYDLFLKFFEFLSERLNVLEFGYEDFVFSFNQLRKYFEANKIEPAPIYATADNFLQFLYELNIVGFWAQGNKKEILYFCVANRSYANIRPKVTSHVRYRLHYGIARALYPARIS